MFVQWIVGRVLRLVSILRFGPRGDDALIQGMTAHLREVFGAEPSVFHEIVSANVHLDIFVVPPGPDRDYYTLVTTGMSEKPMPVPAEMSRAARHVELVMMLPSGWQLEQRAFENERWYWPLRHLKMLARAPHEWNTWFGPGHTVQFDADMKPFASDTAFCAYLLVPEPFGDEFSPLRLPDGREVQFLMAVPIYAEELAFAREKGSEQLAHRFEECDVGLVVDPARANVCAPKTG